MKIVQFVPVGAVMALTMAGVSACDSGASAVRAPTGSDRIASRDSAPASDRAMDRESRPDGRREAPVRLVSGKPYWAANRTRSAEENAQRSFERNGETFSAKSVDDYVAKVHGFVSDPPDGAETLKRANGDLLIYDRKGNVFAVVSRDGAPRTMFKPDEGEAYWDEQKAREARRASASKREGAIGRKAKRPVISSGPWRTHYGCSGSAFYGAPRREHR
jgi:pyocin large subunit-like protein